jgi:alkaline phosphatase D
VVSEVTRRAGEEPGRSLMTEFVGTSISSLWPEPLAKPMHDALPANPQVRYYESQKRGYMHFDVTPERLNVEMRAIDRTDQPGGTVHTDRTFVVENGQVGAKS